MVEKGEPRFCFVCKEPTPIDYGYVELAVELQYLETLGKMEAERRKNS